MSQDHSYQAISWKPPKDMDRKIREIADSQGLSISDLLTRYMAQPLGMPEYQDYTSKRGRPEEEKPKG